MKLFNYIKMEENHSQRQKANLYPQLFNIFGCFQTFISQPCRYISITLLFHLCYIIYFMVTIKQSGVIYQIFTITCYVLVSVIQFSLAAVDPGIIPKFSLEKKQQIPLSVEQARKGRDGGVFKRKQYNLTIKTHYLGIKYCGNCSIYRPPRAIHCYTCGVCIQTMDHHCPWLGVCIGKRNYRYYLLYILLMEAACALISVQSTMFIFKMSFEDQKVSFIFNIILLVLAALGSIFILTLIVVHFKLSKENMTTNELYHNKWERSSGNPYQKQIFFENWINIFHKRYPSKYNFHEGSSVSSTKKIQSNMQQFDQIKINLDHFKNSDYELKQVNADKTSNPYPTHRKTQNFSE